MVNTFDLKLKKDGQDVVVKLRLTLGAQVALKKKYNEPMNATIFGAMVDAEKMAEVLSAALTWNGNENPIKDGEELYDILVDNGYCGELDFGGVITNIAVASGVLTKKQRDAVMNQAKSAQNELLEEANAKN